MKEDYRVSPLAALQLGSDLCDVGHVGAVNCLALRTLRLMMGFSILEAWVVH